MKIDNEAPLMAHNISGDYDFSKLKKVPADSCEAKLFKIIDDISTAGDMFKPDEGGFERYVYKKVEEASLVIVSDGYELYYAE